MGWSTRFHTAQCSLHARRIEFADQASQWDPRHNWKATDRQIEW